MKLDFSALSLLLQSVRHAPDYVCALQMGLYQDSHTAVENIKIPETKRPWI
jgi:hypothetical protein